MRQWIKMYAFTAGILFGGIIQGSDQKTTKSNIFLAYEEKLKEYRHQSWQPRVDQHYTSHDLYNCSPEYCAQTWMTQQPSFAELDQWEDQKEALMIEMADQIFLYGAEHLDASMVLEAFNHGASCAALSETGYTALHVAIASKKLDDILPDKEREKKRMDVVKVLLQSGADAFTPSSNFNRATPFHLAVQSWRLPIIILLLQQRWVTIRAPYRTDDNRWVPVEDLAPEPNRDECIKLLQNPPALQPLALRYRNFNPTVSGGAAASSAKSNQ